MTSRRLTADLAFLGHVCFDGAIPVRGAHRVAPGSAGQYGALAATRGGTSVGVVRMAPYIARRLGHDPDDSLSFAAALVYLKIEKAGIFRGTPVDVLERMEAKATSTP